MRQILNRRRSFPNRPRQLRAFYGGETLPVTFPSSPLATRVHIALGADLTASHLTWNWLDVTEWVRHDLGITVTAGRQDERTQVTPSRCQIKLENTDGRFTRRNPLGPYFGLLTRNTPIWIELNPGSGFVDRYHGFVNEWPTRWTDPSGTDCYVTVQCAGVMRRLAQGETLEPPLHRTILADSPTYYWRVEDPAESTSAASSLPGVGPAMSVSGTIGWRQIESAPGGTDGTNAPAMNGGALIVDVSQAAPWTVEWSVQRPTDGSLDGFPVMTITYLVGGSPAQLAATVTADTNVTARDWYHYKVTAEQIGANYELRSWKNGIAQGVVPGHSGAGTLGTSVNLYAGNQFGGAPLFGMGYFAIYGHLNVDAQVHRDALQAYSGEMAHERIERVCGEAGIPVRALAGISATLGPQPSGSVLTVLRDAERADQGVLHEYQFGLGYQALSERYNQNVAFNLDFDAGHIAGTPEPADDDQRLVNRFTADRSGGSSVTAEQDAGTLGTGPGGSGVYDDSATVNVESDSQLSDYAGWKVHLGTVDEDRWPQIGFHLHGNPDLIPGWLAVPFGARVNIANPPAQMPQDTIDGIIEGYAERWDTVSWSAGLNVSPASPYQVGVYGTAPTVSRYDSANSSIGADIGTGDTSLSVATTTGHALWITGSSSPNFPFDIGIGGERMSVTAISGGSSPQTFTVTRSVNGVVKSHSSGAQVRLWTPGRYAR